MECPSCRKETRIQEQKTEYIYPKAFLGMPTFWAFMSPPFTRIVTAVLAVAGMMTGILGVKLLLDGSYGMGIALLLLLLMLIYSVAVCVYSLDKYQVKIFYKCLSCRLEWYEFVENKQ